MSARRRPVAARHPERAPLVVPLPPRLVWRGLLALGGGLGLALAVAVWSATGAPARLWEAVVAASARQGLALRQLHIEGRSHADRVDVVAAVMDGGTDSLLVIDPSAVRERLLALDWVADAEVGRIWPDTVVVRLAERRPVALWQHRGELAVIDAEGEILPAADPGRFAGLPRLVGADAALHAQALFQLLAATPELGGEVVAAVRVGGRRWDLHLASGETVALPEGDEAARRAWQHFASLDRAGLVRQQGFARFDFRIPDRMVVRLADGDAPRPRPMGRPPAPPPAPPDTQGVTI